MQATIIGKAYVLGDDIDTDQIIPAEHLKYNPADPNERRFFGMHALSGVPARSAGLPGGGVRFVEPGEFRSRFTILIGGRNFGCGSSREHAPLALAEAGVRAIVAQFYARIFYRNCVNGGYLLPCESQTRLVEQIRTGDQCEIDPAAGCLIHRPSGARHPLKPLGDVRPIIEAGGIFEYARRAGMLKQ